MAFRPPQRIQTNRQAPVPASPEEPQSSISQQRKRSLDDSQEEWVLFSPAPPSTAQTETTSTDRTPRTHALSRLSDFGSLDTGAARSDNVGGLDEITEAGSDQDDDAELDSLDDGLHAFHEPSDLGSPRARMIKSNETVLPTHDGLGTFGESSAIQDHLRQFERYAPRRKHKRRSSIQRTLDALEEVEERNAAEDRIDRIERWRLEQSKALLEEIQLETRRMRRLSRASAARSRASSINMQTKSETNFSESLYTVPAEPPQVPHTIPEDGPPENESFWQRFTRKIIHNLIGIDEALLSVILGESLPEEALSISTTLPPLTEPIIEAELAQVEETPYVAPSWQERLLERLARELGILVHQLSEHPGAFSTYMRSRDTPSYAGLPGTNSTPNLADADPDSLFGPSLPNAATPNDPSNWGIDSDPSVLDSATKLRQEQEYWEKELDVRMVFNFLKSRFSSTPTPVREGPLRRESGAAFTAHRAAIIRQHHPLAGQMRRKESFRGQGVRRPRTSSSCASQSTKKSRSKTGSGRNYWDVASVGSGPTGVGVWGEVSI